MNELFEKLNTSIAHIKAFNDFFSDVNNYNFPDESVDYAIHNENLNEMLASFSEIGLFEELYSQKNRQMILADLMEYIFLGRGFYAIGTRRSGTPNKERFLKGMLHFINLLMCYESITVDENRRNSFLDFLCARLPDIAEEPGFSELRQTSGLVGTPESSASAPVNNYFDKLLPKTAGGLWHELLVYIFVLRNDLGYILPLLLHQKIYSKNDHLVPPDFLLITRDKRIYGIEVGIKKEIQSGSFSLKTAIPTATIDTINSRNSDRCPICKKWINFCPFVVNKFSDFSQDISRVGVKCLTMCNKYERDQIINGECPYSKYSRARASTRPHTHHPYSDGKHYHYSCVLSTVDSLTKDAIVAAQDDIAIKTHIPYYSGLEDLFKNDTIEPTS